MAAFSPRPEVASVSTGSLPPNWTEHVSTSASVGNHYFYNSVTDVSQFEFPADELPPNWQVHISSSRNPGARYFWNEVTGESIFDWPTEDQAPPPLEMEGSAPEPATAAAAGPSTPHGRAQSTIDRKELPPGWSKHVSTSARPGETYWWNEETNTTTFEFPMASSSAPTRATTPVPRRPTEGGPPQMPPREGQKVAVEPEPVKDIGGGKFSVVHESGSGDDRTKAGPPEGFDKNVFPADVPSAEPEVKSEPEPEPSMAAVPAPLAADPTLPAGWEAHTSRGTGKTYYYHTETDKTTYQRPVAAATEEAGTSVAEVVPAEASPEAPKDKVKVKSAGRRGATTPRPWNACCSSPPPVVADKGEEEEAPQDGAAEPQPTPLADPTLPAGWEAHTSRSTGKTYYYHAVTDKTTYQRPGDREPVVETAQLSATQAALPVAREMQAQLPATTTAPAPQEPESGKEARSKPSQALPPKWTSKTSSKGFVYFYNELTGVSQREFPDESEHTLPHGWSKQSSASNDGACYYFNSATGECVWERPMVKKCGRHTEPELQTRTNVRLSKKTTTPAVDEDVGTCATGHEAGDHSADTTPPLSYTAFSTKLFLPGDIVQDSRSHHRLLRVLSLRVDKLGRLEYLLRHVSAHLSDKFFDNWVSQDQLVIDTAVMGTDLDSHTRKVVDAHNAAPATRLHNGAEPVSPEHRFSHTVMHHDTTGGPNQPRKVFQNVVARVDNCNCEVTVQTYREGDKKQDQVTIWSFAALADGAHVEHEIKLVHGLASGVRTVEQHVDGKSVTSKKFKSPLAMSAMSKKSCMKFDLQLGLSASSKSVPVSILSTRLKSGGYQYECAISGIPLHCAIAH